MSESTQAIATGRANSETIRFYARYQLWTALLPSFAAALACFGLAWVSIRLSGQQQTNPLSLTGIFLIFVCAIAPELFARLGFMLLGLNKRIVRRDEADRERLRLIVSSEEEKRQEIEPALLDIGPVPFFAVGGYTKNQFWVSRHTLHTTSAEDLRQLMAHERAHLEQGAWLDRLLITAAFWWIPAITAARLAPNWLIALAIAMLAASIFVRVNGMLTARQEARADSLALETQDRGAYAAALARQLAQLDSSGSGRLARRRLARAGYSSAEIEAALSA